MSDKLKDLKMVEDAANALAEHFDSVQIYTTRYEPAVEDGTVNIAFGVGNFFTRYGQVIEWIAKQDERSRESVRKEE